MPHPAALTDDYSYHLAKTVGAGLGRRAMVRAVLTAPETEAAGLDPAGRRSLPDQALEVACQDRPLCRGVGDGEVPLVEVDDLAARGRRRA